MEYFFPHLEHIYTFCPYVLIVHGWINRFHCQIRFHSIYILWNKYVRVLRTRPFCWTFWNICHTKRLPRHERILCVFSNQRFWRRYWHTRCIGTPWWKWLEMPRTRVSINPPGQWLAILQNITIYGSQDWPAEVFSPYKVKTLVAIWVASCKKTVGPNIALR